MLTQPALNAVPRGAPHPHAIVRWSPGRDRRLALAVQAVGYLVPRGNFAARVHSTFQHACNLEYGAVLITLVAPRAGNGPASLRFGADALPDLRRVFDVGEAVQCRGDVVHAERVAIDFAHAPVWRPAPRLASVRAASLKGRLQRAESWLGRRETARPGVLGGAAQPTAAALLAACRACDNECAVRHARRLIGWGEGLTPAGDDFLVGLCAGLDALVVGDPLRAACRTAIGAALLASLPRTTRISAHHLRLAADGHYSERVLDARDAVLGERPWTDVETALHAAWSVGASSGADMLSGLLGALVAWSPRLDD